MPHRSIQLARAHRDGRLAGKAATAVLRVMLAALLVCFHVH
jgi:hypothetical protein